MENPLLLPRVTIDPLGKIREQFDSLPAAQRQVGQVFLDDPEASVRANVENHVDAGAVESAIGKLAAARRIDCYSVGFISTFLATDVQARLSRLGLTANAYFDAHMQLISAASLSSHDVVLAISHVGRMPTLLDAVDVAREQGATVIGVTQPDTPLAQRCTIPLTVVVPEDAVVRVGTEACLAGLVLNEILMVGVGLLLGPTAIDGLTRIREVLRGRGIDSEGHPALQWAWSKAERDAVADE